MAPASGLMHGNMKVGSLGITLLLDDIRYIEMHPYHPTLVCRGVDDTGTMPAMEGRKYSVLCSALAMWVPRQKRRGGGERKLVELEEKEEGEKDRGLRRRRKSKTVGKENEERKRNTQGRVGGRRHSAI